MKEIIVPSTAASPIPLPSVNVNIRLGVMSDLPFLDSLQKRHTKQVGWMPTKQFEGKILAGHVLIAEESEPQRHGGTEARSNVESTSVSPCLRGDLSSRSIGYCIGQDQYFKRDDVGIIYQMNVLPGRQRGLIGATLLQAMFDRAAYGCKLFCCWCAQDIAANQFWEAMGFVPLAYRAGSEKKSRTHIFWQKRIRQGDTTTPWWFPSKTNGGSIREDRIVLPIPPGTHWSDAKPLILPAMEMDSCRVGFNPPSSPGETRELAVRKHGGLKPTLHKAGKTLATEASPRIRRNGLLFDIPKQGEPLPETKLAKQPKPKAERVKRICDPRLVSAARELRDRWLEQVNADPSLLRSIEKYDVGKSLIGTAKQETLSLPQPIAA